MAGSVFGGLSLILALVTLIVTIILTVGDEKSSPTTAAPPNPALSASLNSSTSTPVKRDGYSISVNFSPPSMEDLGASGGISYAFPAGKMPPEPTLPDTRRYAACREWALKNGGYDYGNSITEIVIASQSAQVVVESVQPEVRDLLQPERMDVFRCGGGDILIGRYLNLDLSTGTSGLYHGTFEKGGEYLPFTGLLIKPGEAEKIQLLATQGKPAGLMRWRLRLNLIIDGMPTSRYIDNSGEELVNVGSAL